jgi:glycosyltransferase involved in cell wall biosynthesis
VNYFAEHGWKVDLITWHPPVNVSKIHPEVAVHRIFSPPHYIARYVALLEITRLIKKIHPDIIHAFYLGHFGILAGLYGRLLGFRPIILTAWGSDILIDAKGFKKGLIKYALKRADLITCDGENLKEAMTNLGTDPKKIKIIYHGVDTKKFSQKKRNNEFREELKTFDSPIIISNRKLEPIYNVELLIKAIPLVLKDFLEAKFVIVGKGSQENYLKKLAQSIGVWDSIRFIGWLPRNEFIRCLASADIYVSTSLSDSVAVSIMEAMACELPVVVTDSGDNRKWIKDGKNGFIVPTKDPKALAEKIIYLLGSEDIRKRFGKINREIIEEKAEYNKEMEKMEKFYEEIINEG